jgi:hypothetical protein
MATATPLQPAAPRRGFKGLLARHPLVSYFLIAFTFYWLLFLPGLLTYFGVLCTREARTYWLAYPADSTTTNKIPGPGVVPDPSGI